MLPLLEILSGLSTTLGGQGLEIFLCKCFKEPDFFPSGVTFQLDLTVESPGQIATFKSLLLYFSSESRCRHYHSFGDYVALAPQKQCQDVGTRVVEVGCNLQCTQGNHFNLLEDSRTSLPSPERALSLNLAATITPAAGCYLGSMARSYVG